MKPHRYDRNGYPDFITAPPGDSRLELRNPERAVGRWMVALALIAAVLVVAGVI